MNTTNTATNTKPEIIVFDSRKEEMNEKAKEDCEAKYSQQYHQENEVPETRATWDSDAQKIHVVTAYRRFRPLGAAHGEVTNQWLAMTEAVSEQSPDSQPFAKQTVINKLKDLMEHYEPTFSAYDAAGPVDDDHFESDLEREAYKTWKLYKKDVDIPGKEKADKKKAAEKEEAMKRTLQDLGIKGNEAQQKKRKVENVSDDNETEEAFPPNIKDTKNIAELKKLWEISQRQHKEQMAAFKANTEAINANTEAFRVMHRAFLQFNEK